jgi:hypothetical protein
VTPARALYAYAVVPGSIRLGVVRGIEDEPVEVVAGSRLGLVASEVDVESLAQVNGATDDASLAVLARRHDAVVREAAAVASGVLPFRLGTVVSDREAARRYLEARADALGAALGRVEACQEWGVTVREPSGGGIAERAQRERAAPERADAGTAHLARRRQELARVEELRRWRARAGAEVSRELRATAIDAAAGRIRGDDMLLSQSYLVRREAESTFLDAVDRCGDRLAECGLRLQLSGPWAPYSFALAGPPEPEA